MFSSRKYIETIHRAADWKSGARCLRSRIKKNRFQLFNDLDQPGGPRKQGQRIKKSTTAHYRVLGIIYASFFWYFPQKSKAHQMALRALQAANQGFTSSVFRVELYIEVALLQARAGNFNLALKAAQVFIIKYMDQATHEQRLQVVLALLHCYLNLDHSNQDQNNLRSSLWIEQKFKILMPFSKHQNHTNLHAGQMLSELITCSRASQFTELLLRALLLYGDFLKDQTLPMNLKSSPLFEARRRAKDLKHRPVLLYLKHNYPYLET